MRWGRDWRGRTVEDGAEDVEDGAFGGWGGVTLGSVGEEGHCAAEGDFGGGEGVLDSGVEDGA